METTETVVLELHVSGMKCQNCANKVRSALLQQQNRSHVTHHHHHNNDNDGGGDNDGDAIMDQIEVVEVDVHVDDQVVLVKCRMRRHTTGASVVVESPMIDWDSVRRAMEQRISNVGFNILAPAGPLNLDSRSHLAAAQQTLSVSGMKCGNCQRKVTGLLQGLQDVDPESVNVDLERNTATFRATSSSAAVQVRSRAIDAIRSAGFQVVDHSEHSDHSAILVALDDYTGAASDHPSLQLMDMVHGDGSTKSDQTKKQSDVYSIRDSDDITLLQFVESEPGTMDIDLEDRFEIDMSQMPGFATGVFRISGMSCSACVSKIEETAMAIEGIMSASVNLITHTATVRYKSNAGLADVISNRISSIGYECVLVSEQAHNDDDSGNNVDGVDTASSRTTLHADIEGMTCASCVTTIENHVLQIAGVETATVNLLTKVGTFVFDPNATGARVIIDHINSIGFTATVRKDSDIMAEDAANASNREIALWRRRFIVSALLGIPLFVISMGDMLFSDHSNRAMKVRTVDWLIFLMSTPVYLYGGWHFHSRSYMALRHGYADMNVLISVSTTAAFLYSTLIIFGNILFGISITEFFFETAAMIIAFQNTGKYLEAIAKKRTSHALAELLRLQARSAILLIPKESTNVTGEFPEDDQMQSGFEEREIDIELLQRGDLVKVLPGEKIPTDGVVESGISSVDESMITGESRSVLKEVGSNVIGSTINEDGALIVRATRVGKDTMLAQIMRLVQEAQSSKPRIQRFDDALSRVFVPFIALLASLVFLWWFCISVLGIVPVHWIPSGYNSLLFSLLFSMAILAIACPCALGLATPTAIMVGCGVGAKHGILFKSGEAFETLTQVNYIVFDKTGTLTEGKPTVVHAELYREGEHVTDKPAIEDHDALVTMWNYIGTAESGSEHPLGRSLYGHAKEVCEQNNVRLISSAMQMGELTFTTLPGRGITCIVPARPQASHDVRQSTELNIFIGKRSFVEQSTGMEVPSHSPIIDKMDMEEQHGRTVIWCGVGERVLGFVSLFDVLKADARSVIRMLEEMKIETCIASGDRRMPVKSIAKKLGIRRVLYECLPEQKLQEIKRLQRKGHTVALVGDGINDSPSLAKADVGVAIGAGAEVAIQSADVVLVKSDLGSLITSLDLARKVYNRIKLNHVWALGYNVVLVPLAAGILYPLFKVQVPPLLAAVSMMSSSLLVLGSSLLLNTYRTPFRVRQSRRKKQQRKQRRRALRDTL